MTFKKGHKPFAGIEKGWFKKGHTVGRRFQKGQKSWNVGKHLTEEHKEKLRLAHLGKLLGENNSKWAGDKVGYFALHTWLGRHFPKPELCQMCNNKKPQHIANMSGIYNREFKNWKYLCAKCHINYDRRNKK